MNMMQEALCMCCSDITRYKRKSQEVSNKIRLLKGVITCQNINNEEYKEFERKFHHKIYILQNDKMHCHFMCGECRKAKTNELSIKEDQLRELLWKVFFLIYSTGDERLYHNTLRILQGDYPITYRNLEQLWYLRKKVCVNE